MYADKYVHKIEDVPTQEHFVILKSGSVYIPGDERSHTNPGHGYPAENHQYIEYEVYLTKQKLLEAIKELDDRKTEYKVLTVKPMTIIKTISLELT